MAASRTTRILILGGGYVGLYTAWGLEKLRGATPIDVTVVEPNPYMTYQPLLPEVAGGHVQPRHVTVPLVQALKRTRIVRGAITGVSLAERSATVAAMDGTSRTLPFDHVVFALGAVTAAIGPNAAMACTAAVETEIDHHYQEQLEVLGTSDPELTGAIADFQAEELEHRDHAIAAGAENVWGYPVMSGLIRLGCKVAIAAAKRI